MFITRPFAALALALPLAAFAQTKWDLPAAYPATNFHTENLVQFANDVDKASGGKLKISVHANASLFKAPEIKRAVQGGQAQIGEILLVNFAEREPAVRRSTAFRSSPPATAMRKAVRRAEGRARQDCSTSQGMKLLFSVPWPPQGIYAKKEIDSVADMRGIKWRAYSPGHREDRRTDRRAAGARSRPPS